MKKYLVLGMLALLFAVPLSAAENVKIKLPDGLYMYDSSIERLTEGGERVGFGKYFVVKNNTIYSSQEAIRIFGASKLNSLFTKDKNYKILFGGENIGKIYNVKIDDEGDWNYKEELLTKNIKEGPAYGRESILLGRLGSAVKYLAVPEEYKEVKKKVYITIPQEEVDKISRLIQDKLFDLVKNRKEITQNKACHINNQALPKHEIELLDKISDRNGILYIGIDTLGLATLEKGMCWYEIVFSVKSDNVHAITTNYDDATLSDGGVSIEGMLDVDGDGSEELIIKKSYGGLGEAFTNLEIYKQKAGADWKLIKKISWRDEV